MDAWMAQWLDATMLMSRAPDATRASQPLLAAAKTAVA
jgi:hypothetical protein